MFQYAEFQQFFRTRALPAIEGATRCELMEILEAFDTEAADHRKKQEKWELSYGAMTSPVHEIYRPWWESIIEVENCSYKKQYYYGMLLFHSGISPKELPSVRPLSNELLRKIPEYERLEQKSMEVSVSMAEHLFTDYATNCVFIQEWSMYSNERYDAFARAFVNIGHIAAVEESKQLEEIQKLFALKA